MQTGRPVILLNLDHLYESLYDALNQVSHSTNIGPFINKGFHSKVDYNDAVND